MRSGGKETSEGDKRRERAGRGKCRKQKWKRQKEGTKRSYGKLEGGRKMPDGGTKTQHE